MLHIKGQVKGDGTGSIVFQQPVEKAVFLPALGEKEK
jgi:hypothetical protein